MLYNMFASLDTSLHSIDPVISNIYYVFLSLYQVCPQEK